VKPLRIFYAVHPSPNAIAFPRSQLWRQNLYEPLVDLGHDVVEFDYDMTPHFQHLDPADPEKRAFIERNRPRLERELLRQVEEAHRHRPIDLFFSYFYSACVTPETIREIRRLGILTVNWYCNGSYQFDLVADIAPAYDYCLVPEEFRLADYRRIGAHPLYCQEAANPNVYRRRDLPVEFDVTFVGQRYGDRPAYIRRLLDAGVDVRVWGPGWLPAATATAGRSRWRKRLELLGRPSGWRHLARRVAGRAAPAAPSDGIPLAVCGPPLPDDQLIGMYSRSKISLGFSTCGDTHLTDRRIVQVRLRDFEAPMSGAFYMVEHMPELEQFFEPDREIVCYSGPEEMVDKARYYLAHDDERERIRQAGHARALRDHTWHRRFETAFAQMGLT
jgi:spore maturation protein CgeB